MKGDEYQTGATLFAALKAALLAVADNPDQGRESGKFVFTGAWSIPRDPTIPTDERLAIMKLYDIMLGIGAATG